EQRLQALAKQIFVISDPARAGPGFVLGPIVIRGTHDHEVSTVKFYAPDRRDLTLEINSSAVTPDESRRLLQRSQAALPLFRRGGAKLDTLRSGRRAFAGMEGEEDVLGSDSMQDDGARVRRLLFSAETYRPDPGLSRPTLTVQLKSGGHLSWLSDAERQARRDAPDFLMTEGYLPRFAAKSRQSSAARIPPITSSLTDYEAMSAWDAILPTIRLRSGALPRPDAGDDRASPISREQAERDRRALDDFLSSWPVDNPDKSAS
ncbi:T6SS immunity protein Tli4 family protein, partial [Serratia sp. Se-RSmG]|nr:T6SS immunity protein Tli4 family protein [Serratia sp. Se-RSmG]